MNDEIKGIYRLACFYKKLMNKGEAVKGLGYIKKQHGHYTYGLVLELLIKYRTE